MLKYQVNIAWSEPDKAFVAEVPELQGCMADGKTHAAALQAVDRMMREWIDVAKSLGRPVPKSRGRLHNA